VLAYQRLELGDHLGVAAERELHLDELLERGRTQVLEAGDLVLGERFVGQVGERRIPPQRERPLERVDGRVGAARGELARALGGQPARTATN
jgi:hypothetical protein